MNYRYVSMMPIDGTRTIVHLKADDPNARFRFISFENTGWVDNGGFPVEGRRDIIVIPKPGRALDELLIKYELSKIHGCPMDRITISVSQGPIRDKKHDEQKYRRKMRYSHGLDPNAPPPGWIPR